MTSAREQARRLAELLRAEHGAMADFLVALAEFDRARAWVELGYASLFLFLQRGLGLSSSSAYFRQKAAQLVSRFPSVVEPLRDGRLCITTVFQLAKVLTEENEAEVLPRFFRCSKEEAMAIVADLLPAPAVPGRSVVRSLPARAPESLPRQSPPPPTTAAPPRQPSEPALPSPPPAPPPSRSPAGPPQRSPDPTPSAPRDELTPLTRDRARLHVTVTRAFVGKLEEAQHALSHARPRAGAGELLEVGLDLILAGHARRMGLVARPRAPRPGEELRPGGVPAWVRREVWRRDGGRCQWPLDRGGVCGSRLRVELDHVKAKALGGKATVAGMRLLCRFHNQLAAREAFGDAWMDRFTRDPRASEEGVGYAGRLDLPPDLR